MKKQFSRNNNSGLLTPSRVLLAGLFVVLLILVVIRMIFPDSLVVFTKPLFASGEALTGFIGGTSDSATRERDELLRALADEKAKYASLEASYKEVTGFSPDVTGLLAGVIARPPVSPYDVLVVSAGERTGVSSGMVAYTSANIPVGTVEQVSDTSARVLLYSAPERVTEGWIGEAKVPVSLVGRGGGAFVGELSKEVAVAVGDGVFIPGPGGQLIGHVVRVDSSPSSPSIIVQIRPLGNPFSITWVKLR